MSRFYFVITLFISATAFARPQLTRFQGCGEYRIQGRVALEDRQLILRVLPGTLSEVKLKLSDKRWFEDAFNHKDQDVFVTGRILKGLNTYSGTLERPMQTQPMQETLINYADLSHGNAYQLIKSLACQ